MPIERVYLRTSERSSYKTCRQQWQWLYNDRWRPREVNRHLRFGDLVHQAMAKYYKPGRKRGPHPAQSFIQIYDEKVEEGFSLKGNEDDWVDARDMGVAMLEGYVERWGDWDADRVKVLWAEMPFQLDLYHKDKYLVTYAGTFDTVFYDLEIRKIGLFEHKTAAAISTNHLSLDEQAGSYWAFAGEYLRNAGILKPGREISFIMYNFLRKALPDQRPVDEGGRRLNKDGSISKNQPSPLFHRQPIYRNDHDRENLIQRVKQEAWEMAEVRAGRIPIYKNPKGSYPDQHCQGCGFREMCELHESGDDWEDYRDMMMEQFNPYEDHDGAKEDDPILEDD